METLIVIAVLLVLAAAGLLRRKGKRRPGRGARRRRGSVVTGLPGKKRKQPRGPAARANAKKAPERLSRAARIIDGDSLVVEVELRLEGIDAPEYGQKSLDASGRPFPQGEHATRYLRKLVGEAPVRCELHGEDKYGRQLATVYTQDGRNVNAEMVRAGQAIAYLKFSRRYEAEEREAKKRRAGMHSGTWITPWAWRSGHRVEGTE